MNIADILKYCPEGTKLYSTVHGDVVLDSVKLYDEPSIVIKTPNAYTTKSLLYKEGTLYGGKGECILFPSKEQRDWNEFRLSIKRGDIMMSIDGKIPFIASGKINTDNSPRYICGITNGETFQIDNGDYCWTTKFYIPATEEIKTKLFAAIKEAGYRWNSETLELEKIEKVKFKPFDKVLVRNNRGFWCASLFSHYDNDITYKFKCINDKGFKYCIPYEGNEHLLGTCRDK